MINSTVSTWYFLISSLGIFHSKSPIVSTKLGDVQGIVSVSRGGEAFYEYRGLPFAQPPINDLRFEAPLPPKPWKGLRKADSWGSTCLQFDAMVRGIVIGDEDCLFLNVFTPNVNPTSLMPVLAYIHGGGFTGGESKLFNPKYLMGTGVVVVTFNYRLASLGFLNTADDVIRGNMGLKDQNLALIWIRDNIKSFGGDLNQITLIGESAGAASVHYHIISPLSRGLFHRAIMQSGNVACPWALTRNPRQQALRFGKLLNCPTENTTVLATCLKKMNARDIVKSHENIMSPIHLQDDFFPGSIEAVVRHDTFLSENPYTMLQRGDFAHIPVIFGINSAEGGLKAARLEAYQDVLSQLDDKWNSFVPILMHYDPLRTNISDTLRNHYFPPMKDANGTLRTTNPSENIGIMVKMLTEGLFSEPNRRVANYHRKYAPTYLYYYSHISKSLPSMYSLIRAGKPKRGWFPWELNVVSGVASDYADKFIRNSKDPRRYGACHAEDLFQLWSFNQVTDIRQGSSDYPFSRALVQTIVQFAKNIKDLRFGNILWPSLKNESIPHLYMLLDQKPDVVLEPFAAEVDFIASLGIRDPYEENNW